MNTLHNWGICQTTERRFWHLAPELKPAVIIGNLGSPDGERVEVWPREVKGRLLIMETETITAVGNPDPEWVRWMTESGIPFDPDHPFKRWEVDES